MLLVLLLPSLLHSWVPEQEGASCPLAVAPYFSLYSSMWPDTHSSQLWPETPFSCPLGRSMGF